jgi:hypothetical protein
MTDELQLLLTNETLQALLYHYANAGGEDREAWLNRVMEWQGTTSDGLIRLHGLLIAFGWIEQNTGNTPVLHNGAAPRCYRASAAGRRALRQVEAAREEMDNEAA